MRLPVNTAAKASTSHDVFSSVDKVGQSARSALARFTQLHAPSSTFTQHHMLCSAECGRLSVVVGRLVARLLLIAHTFGRQCGRTRGKGDASCAFR